MKAQAKSQDALPIEADRHPMWTKPKAEGLPVYVYVLRRDIAKALIPLDGRPDVGYVVDFCKQVYALSRLEEQSGLKDPYSLVGQIVVAGLQLDRKMAGHQKNLHYPLDGQRAVVGRLTKEFAESVAQTQV